MTTLHIEHPITDYPTWRAAYDGFAPARRRAGVLAEHITQPVGDGRYIVVGLDFATTGQAAAFRHLLETQVWTSAVNAPGLAGSPRTMILEAAAPLVSPVTRRQ
jgi:hypothetical protein